MLTRLGIKFGLVSNRATSTFEDEICAFTAGEFGLGAEVTCHCISFGSTAASSKMQEPGDASMRLAVVLVQNQMRRRF